MAVPILTVADAVATALNAAEFSIDFTAKREYVPEYDTTKTTALQVQVVPTQDVRDMESAVDDNALLTIDIGVMKKLTDAIDDEKAEVDALLVLCEEIKAMLNRQRLSGAGDAICVGVAQQIIYDPEQLKDKRVFITVLNATFATTVAV